MISRSVLVGRVSELARLEALAREGAELVTLRGPGGVGKTRLATEHAPSAVFVDLASARTARETTTAFATALGITIDESGAADAIARAARVRRALLVADNAEQLDADARAVVASFAGGGARVIATSREPLGDPREVIVDVEPLAEADALSLFGAAGGGAVDAETARAVIARLDALPLAIELAAARASLLGGAELLARLDKKLDVVASTTRGLPARHASLRATIAWSWELLDDAERAALRACATFEGPFDATLAEAVRGEGDALDALDRLRARALLHVSDAKRERPTFRLLEAVRDFVRDAGENDAFYTRHAEALLARCEPAADAVARGADAIADLARHRGDLVAAARRVRGPLAARAALTVAALLGVTGPASDAVAILSAVLPVSEPLLAARVHVARAAAHRAVGGFDAARADLRAAGEIASVRADVLRVEGAIARTLGDASTAIAKLDEALAIHRAAGERAREGILLNELGAALQSAGRLAAAREKHERAIAIHVATKSRRAEGEGRSHLAVATHRAGEPAAAIPLHEQALAIHRETRHLRLEGAELLHLAFVHHELGAPGAAREAFERARATLAAAGARDLEALAIVLAARLAVDENDLARAAALLVESEEASGSTWSRLAAMRALAAGHLAMARGDAAAARASYAASLAHSSDVVVGFEALTPAYLALADVASRAEHLALARERVARFENPNLAVALAVLAGEQRDVDPGALAKSSEVRRALAFTGTRRALRVESGARRLVLPDGRAIDLSRRKNVVAILAALARERRMKPGSPISADALLAAGWPGERMRAEAATKRLHTAIWTLRSLGLEGILLTKDDGYLLDPSVPAEIEGL
ncbi:MAG TPA: tetratricopeptide repeat protein [Labilithrix sp.]